MCIYYLYNSNIFRPFYCYVLICADIYLLSRVFFLGTLQSIVTDTLLDMKLSTIRHHVSFSFIFPFSSRFNYFYYAYCHWPRYCLIKMTSTIRMTILYNLVEFSFHNTIDIHKQLCIYVSTYVENYLLLQSVSCCCLNTCY